MRDKYGLIWIDGDEIIVRVYEKLSDTWKLSSINDYDLATFIPGKYATVSEIVEVIASALSLPYSLHVVDWRIFARNIDEEILLEVSACTSIQCELLTLQREQDLLCQGILVEMQDE